MGVSLSGLVHAEGGDRAAATALYDDATRLVLAGKHADACPKFEESFKLDASGAAAFEAGQCRERVGQVATAWSWYKEALDRARAKKSPKEKEIAAKVDALDKRIPRLTVVLAPEVRALPGLLVRRNGVEMGPSQIGIPLPVDPGPRSVEVTATGKRAFSATVEAREGRSETVTVSALEDVPVAPASHPAVIPSTAPPPPSASTSAADPPRSPATATEKDSPVGRPGSSGMQRTVGYVAGGVGIVGVALGTYFLLQYNSGDRALNSVCKDSNCPDLARLKSARDQNTPGIYGGFIGGGALLITGAVLLLTAPSGTAAARTVVAPTLMRGGGGVGLSGSF